MFELRKQQAEALRSVANYFETENGSPLLSIPTGGGKSLIIAEWLKYMLEVDPDCGVLVLAHVSDLLLQNMAELKNLWPEAPCGLYSAKLGKKDISAQIMFASINSIYKRAYDIPRAIHMVVIDEAHLVSNAGNSMYRKFFNDLKIINPTIKFLGLSATPYRLGSGLLTEGTDRIFTDLVYQADILELINDGYLVPLVTAETRTKFDVSGVATSGGDYVQSQLEAAVDVDEITQAAVHEIVALGADRRTWLVFCSGVKHSYHVRDAIRSHGISCETITGETPQEERTRLLDDYRAGRLRCLTNANCLTTGINVRSIDLIALMRPTKSASLYVQMVGRATRLSPETGKVDGLILDMARNVELHGPIDKIRVKPKGKGGEAPTKTCAECDATVYASAKICPNCCAPFPPPVEKEKLTARASNAPILSNQNVAPEWLDVSSVSYRRHTKAGKPDSFKATYLCGLQAFHEWVCIQHEGGARNAAVRWWKERSTAPVPATVDEALARTSELKTPARIAIKPDGKFIRVVSHAF